MSKRVVLVLVALLTATGAAWAQVPGSTVPPEPDKPGIVPPAAMAPSGMNGYGIQNYSAAVTPPHAFQPYEDGLGWMHWSGGYIGPMSGDTHTYFIAPVDLPTGALIDSVRVLVYDNHAAAYVHILLYYEQCVGGAACTTTELYNGVTGGVETPGYDLLGSDEFDPLHGMTWRNFDSSTGSVNYGRVRVWFSAASSNLRIGPVWFWYRRQISPEPAVATFPDVAPGFWAFQEIEALASSGITTGFPDGTFRPLEPVTRAQMATFLARALGLDYPDFGF